MTLIRSLRSACPQAGALLLALVAFLVLVAPARAAPTNTVLPAISGTALEGQSLSSTTGTWTGTGTITYARRWQRCDYAGLNCTNLASTGTTYTVVAADVGGTLRISVTATDSTGPATAVSAATAVVAGNPPTNSVAPAVTGNTRVGQVLTTSNGTWSGTAPITYTYEWLRCDGAGGACAAIAGATGSTYTLVAADLATTVRSRVTATNVTASANATSLQTAAITPAQPPVNTVLPSISGTVRDGQTLTSTNGTWTGASTITYTRQWQRCDAGGGSCANIGVTSPTHLLISADVGSTMRVVVTATNPDGSASATSAVTVVVAVNPPASATAPLVSGTLRAGHTLSTTNGTWTGTAPLAYTYAWLRCDGSGGSCVAIGGATASSHVLTVADVGSTIRSQVTATNAGGSASRTSAQTATIGPSQPPVNTAEPTITGTARDGQVLTSATGTWSGAATITYARSWQRCNSSGVSCVAIGVTNNSYTLTPVDVGSTIRVAVTATNPDGSAVATSQATAVIAPNPPANTTPPSITGTARDGLLLSTSTGSWTGTPTVVLGYQWQRCDGTGGSCSPIAGATASTYLLQSVDVGSTIRSQVSGTNAGGSVSASSAQTAVVASAPPAATVAPSIAGLAREAEVLTASPGTWTGTPPLSFSYQWRRCNSVGGACANIPGEVGLTYTLVTADVGSTVRFQVTATNLTATVVTSSAQTVAVAPLPPASTSPPVISGTLADGSTLATTNGVWSGTPSLVFGYQWQRCSPACVSIGGATAVTYELVSADVGTAVRVIVTASNAGGTGTATSAQTGTIVAVAPSPASPPVITGTPRDASTLTASTGGWNGTTPQTYTYDWRRCDVAGGACVSISGAVAAAYTATPADVGSTLRVAVTATNSVGSAISISDRTSIVAAAPPASTAAPGITGTPKDGSTLTADPGGWTGTPPLAYAYQWRRCNPGCADIAGAASQSYVLNPADVGATVRVVVTASNAGGSAAATSPPTAAIQPFPPANTAAPTVTGTAADGHVLTALPGTWTGIVPITFAYRWWRCDTGGANCSAIPGAVAQQYQVAPADVGLTLQVEVTGTNSDGAASAFSAVTSVVQSSPPQSLVVPSLAGYLGVGQILTADPGSWFGSPTITYSYTWLRCDAFGAACLPIAGANGQTYTIVALDLGFRLRVRVGASNPAGSASADSLPTWGPVRDDPPVATVSPAIAGVLVAHGQVLAAQPGTWTGYTPMTASYRWRRCDAAGAGCADIAGATGTAYTPVAADIGFTLRVLVTMDNGIGSVGATSAFVGPVLPAPPANTLGPAVAGTALAGDELTGSAGAWSGGEPMLLVFTWKRCAPDGTACAPIPGANGASYTAADADIGSAIRLTVTATNVTASLTVDSPVFGPIAARPPGALSAPSVALKGNGAVLRAGSELLGTAGGWSGTPPLSFSYQWQRCTSTTACADIPGATVPGYLLTADDVDRTVRLVVGVSNQAGTAVAASPPTDVVAGVAPSPARLPLVAGRPRVGQVLTVEPGEWDGTGSIGHLFTWLRCKATGKDACAPIEDANHRRYTVTEDDVGARLAVRVRATNDVGSAEARSRLTAIVTAVPPAPGERPVIRRPAEALAPGVELAADLGSWTGTKPIELGVEWLRCAPGGGTCRIVAEGSVYTVRERDLRPAVDGAPRSFAVSFRVVVTARNSAGRASSRSGPFGALGPPAGVSVRPGDVVLDDAGRVVVTLRCRARVARPCRGRVVIRSSAFQRRLRFRVVPGSSRVIRLRLTSPERAALAGVDVVDVALEIAEKGRRRMKRTLRVPVTSAVRERRRAT